MIIKVLILNTCLLVNALGGPKTENNKKDSGTYEISKVQAYKGKGLEAAYKIKYNNPVTNKIRFFEVIKTNEQYKNYFLADFILVEKVNNGSKMICYPTGWESLKFIKVTELKETCQLIIKGEILSERME